ncbi:MAG: hypothetical protein IT490_05460, partial [Candidatus Contendobacter sp.]|nr:hypothetical protein [Candidatus Contendobacter sp.]
MRMCVFIHQMAVPGRSALAVGAMLAVLAGCVQRDMSDLQYFVEETKRTTPIKKPEPPPEIKPYTPFAYTAQGIKD